MLDLDLAAMVFRELVDASNLCLSLTKCCTADSLAPRSAALVCDLFKLTLLVPPVGLANDILFSSLLIFCCC